MPCPSLFKGWPGPSVTSSNPPLHYCIVWSFWQTSIGLTHPPIPCSNVFKQGLCIFFPNPELYNWLAKDRLGIVLGRGCTLTLGLFALTICSSNAQLQSELIKVYFSLRISRPLSSLKLLKTRLLISLMSGWSSGESSATKSPLHTYTKYIWSNIISEHLMYVRMIFWSMVSTFKHFPSSFTGLGSFSGLRVSIQARPEIYDDTFSLNGHFEHCSASVCDFQFSTLSSTKMFRLFSHLIFGLLLFEMCC